MQTATELTLSLFQYQSQPVLVLQPHGNEATIIHPDGTASRAYLPTSPVQPGSSKAVTDILKQVLFIPKEIAFYQRQCGRVMRELVASGFREDWELENTLRVRLLPVMLTLESAQRSLLQEYEEAVGPLVAAYFENVNPEKGRLLESWIDVSAALNFIISKAQSKNESMRRVLDSALSLNLLLSLLKCLQWVDLPRLVTINLPHLNAETDKSALTEQFCACLCSRACDCPEVFQLLQHSLDFATTAALQQEVVTLSLQYLAPAFQSYFADSQRKLLTAMIAKSIDLVATANIPLAMLFADEGTKEAGKSLVVQQLAKGVTELADYKQKLKDEDLQSCFSRDSVRVLITARRWKCLLQLKNISSHLGDSLKLLLEHSAPQNLLVFKSLQSSVDDISAACIPATTKEASLILCLTQGKWSDKDKKAVGVKGGLIHYRASVYTFLFLKQRTFLKRVPIPVVRMIIAEFVFRAAEA